MAEIQIKSVNVGRSRTSDFGVAEGGRLYYIEYDIPGSSSVGHVHTIPAAALANHRIDSSEEDPMAILDYYILEAVTSNVAVMEMGGRQSRIDPASPIVVAGRAVLAVRSRLDLDTTDLANKTPGDSPEEIQAGVQEVVVSPIAKLSGARALSVPAAARAASRLDTAQQTYAGTLSQTIAAHAVDSSLKPWATLAQMVADDTEELEHLRNKWFNYRYGERIRLTAGLRLRGEQ
jgi:hypothetical protein